MRLPVGKRTVNRGRRTEVRDKKVTINAALHGRSQHRGWGISR